MDQTLCWITPGVFRHTNTQTDTGFVYFILCRHCAFLFKWVRPGKRVSLCQAGPSEASGKEGQGGWRLTLQGWWPGIEVVVRWGCIDQQEGSEDQLVENANWSHVRAMYKTYSMDRLWHLQEAGYCVLHSIRQSAKVMYSARWLMPSKEC